MSQARRCSGSSCSPVWQLAGLCAGLQLSTTCYLTRPVKGTHIRARRAPQLPGRPRCHQRQPQHWSCCPWEQVQAQAQQLGMEAGLQQGWAWGAERETGKVGVECPGTACRLAS